MEELLSNPRNFILLEIGVVIITLLLLYFVNKTLAQVFMVVTGIFGIPYALMMGVDMSIQPGLIHPDLWMPVSIFIVFFALHWLINKVEDS